jgi:hypothetical protein
MRPAIQVYPSSIKEAVGLLMMVPISTGLSVLRAIVSANRGVQHHRGTGPPPRHASGAVTISTRVRH